MAEAVGLLANIIQLLTFATDIYERLEECASSIKGLPSVLEGLHNRMPVLVKALQNTKMAMDAGAMDEQSTTALRQAIRGCEGQMSQLNDIIDKVIPPAGASKFTRKWKAVGSVRYDTKVEKLDDQIQRYVNVLSHYHSTANLVKLAAQPPPVPRSTVPYREDIHFVDRKFLTIQLSAKCEEPAARVALVGPGGVGKSQLAIDYAHKIRKSSPDTWVFWINADSAATFEKGFEDIADKAHIYAYNPHDPERMHTVKRWLMEEKNKWLIILDNADDLNALLPNDDAPTDSKEKSCALRKSPGQDLLALLPQSPNGRYIVTSRNKQAATRIVLGEYHNVIEVEEMDEEDALALLKRKLVESPDDAEAKQLVDAVGRMPLAISNAAAFINERRPQWSVARYIEELDKGDDERLYLLEEDVYDARREIQEGRSNSIVRTWQVSFDHIREHRPSAARLLSLMSLIRLHSIPEYLLVGQYAQLSKENRKRWYNLTSLKQRCKDSSETPIKDDFEGDWRVLHSFSLIKTAIDGHHFSMHKLIQASTRRWLQLHGTLDKWIHRHLEVLNDKYDEDLLERPAELVLHAYTALAWNPSDKETLGLSALLLYKIVDQDGWLFSKEKEEQYFKGAVGLLATAYGRRHHQTLKAATTLADFYVRNGRPAEAEKVYGMVLQAKIKTLGPTHLDTLACMDRLGVILGKQGKYEDWDILFRRTMEIRQRKYGMGHDETRFALRARRVDLVFQGRYEEALEISFRDHDERRKLIGDAYDWIWCEEVELVAGLLHWKGHDKKAESLYRDVISHKERHLGDSHQKTLASVERLCAVSLSQAKWAEVEILCTRVLTHWTDRKEEDKRDAMVRLIYAFLKQNKLEETEALARTVLEESLKTNGAESSEAIMPSLLLGSSLRKQGRYDEALSFLEPACRSAQKTWGEESQDTQEAFKELSRLKRVISSTELAHDSSASLQAASLISGASEAVIGDDLDFQTSCAPQ
ncbi:uncharacterized protein EI97DRAFT_135170 [Westerdykella ornata]|uniref:NACHT-NTPase and P-loop NTPases N-terminal domain-containing protein n=1 Tax=Westerdykella ornata TaxID=318751 RepID=A0A6A6JBT2_WESOR|nr:uncharacterized protein EI97DRAFT_135170 [Westerdykella ornata]KAF2274070.1 hypothetical protein EI97DRAFT_135170 [Westerdykella ornata]